MLNVTLSSHGEQELRARLLRGEREAGALVRDVSRQAGIIAVQEIQQRAPASFRQYIRTHTTGGGVLTETRVTLDTSRKPHAKYVESGTRAHEIRPRFARALRWVVGGRAFFARVVHHPGTKARWFWRDGTAAARPRIERMAARAVDGLVRRLARR